MAAERVCGEVGGIRNLENRGSFNVPSFWWGLHIYELLLLCGFERFHPKVRGNNSLTTQLPTPPKATYEIPLTS